MLPPLTRPQIDYALQLTIPILRGLARSLDVSARACSAYNTRVQAALAASAFVQCRSWYRTGRTGKNFGIFPWHVLWYWWMMRAPRWGAYEAVGVGAGWWWVRARRWIGCGVLVVVAGAVWAVRDGAGVRGALWS